MPDSTPALGSQPSGTTPDSSQPHVKVSQAEIDQFTMRQISKHGNLENAFRVVASEQISNRKRRQRAENTVNTLKSQVPGTGDVVLKGDEATAYTALKTKDPNFKLHGLTDQLTELGTLRSASTQAKREEALKLAAGKQYKVSVLKQLLGDTADGKMGLALEFQSMLKPKDDGSGTETVQVPYVVGVNGVKEPLSGWLDREHKAFASVLQADDTEDQASSVTGPTMPRQTPTLHSSSTKDKANKQVFDAVDSVMNSRYQFGKKKEESKK